MIISFYFWFVLVNRT